MKMNHALGHAIRKFRTERGLTMRAVCRKGYLALGYLSEIERGDKEPSSAVIEYIAGALGVPVWAIMWEATKAMADSEGALTASQRELVLAA